jgi:hypothetical protein
MHTAEPLIPGPNHLEVEIVIAKSEKYKLPGNYQILAEIIQAGCEILVSVIQRKESVVVSVLKKGGGIKLTVIIVMGYHCCLLHTKFYRISCQG